MVRALLMANIVSEIKDEKHFEVTVFEIACTPWRIDD